MKPTMARKEMKQILAEYGNVKVEEAIKAVLTEREKRLLFDMRSNTYTKIANKESVNVERIRQILHFSIMRIRNYLIGRNLEELHESKKRRERRI